MKIAIVILNWNGEKLLEKFLPSVLEQSQGASIYVADNASTDGSVNFIKENYPSIQIIQNLENGGFAKGYNDALTHLTEDIFCLLNSDVEVSKDWLKPIERGFNTLEGASIIQPKILDLLKKDHFEYAGAAGGYIDQLGYPFCRGRIFKTLEKDTGQYDDTKEIFWATGACMFIKKEVFAELNGFDTDYFAHHEEIDLCWRAKNKDHKIYYIGSSKVYHLGGSTLNTMNPKKTFLNFRNSLFSILKNLPLRKALPIIFIRLILDGVAAIQFLLQFRFQHIWAIFTAHMSFYYNFRKMYAKREKNNFTKNYYTTKSIVWSYFVNRKKHFNILVKD